MEAETSSPPRPGELLPSPSWRDALCLGPIALLGLYRYAGASLTPWLIGSHPLLLSALRGAGTSIVTVGAFARVGRAPLWLGLLAPLPILIADDPFWYWAGRRYGRRLLHAYASTPRARRRLARAERLFARFGFWAILAGNLPFVPAPTSLLYLGAGEAGMAFPLFLLADVLGLLLFVAFFLAVGWWWGQSAVSVAEAVSHYAVWMMGVSLAAAVAVAVWTARGQLRAARGGEAGS